MPKQTVKESILSCTACGLHKVGNGPVPYFGRPSKVMVLGEAPGHTEDERGIPFVGPAGKLLWRELGRLSIDRRDVMRANAVSCYPGRTPTEGEIFACRGNLYAQIRYCDPLLILALGKTVNWSLGKKETMSALHGNWYRFPWFSALGGADIKVMPTYHPALVRSNPKYLRAWREDLADFAAEVINA